MHHAFAFGQHKCLDYSNHWTDGKINSQATQDQIHWRKTDIVASFLQFIRKAIRICVEYFLKKKLNLFKGNSSSVHCIDMFEAAVLKYLQMENLNTYPDTVICMVVSSQLCRISEQITCIKIVKLVHNIEHQRLLRTVQDLLPPQFG